MWSSVRSGSRNLLRIRRIRVSEKSFLSDSYDSTDAWNRRLKSPLLSKINPSDMFLEIDQKLTSTGKISTVDVDIYSNTIKDAYQVDELVDILHRLRLTPETTNTMESTHHAVIRYLIDIEKKETLLEILNDRLNYGIFPDHFCCNLLMDKFIKNKDYVSAAKIGSLLMLQEDIDNSIGNELAIYSCHKYLEKTSDWVLPEPPPPPDPKEEIKKVRVKYLRNPYFDDHFDLCEPKHIVGKTLAFLSRTIVDDVALSRSFLLRGYILWQKYKKASELVKSWIDDGVDKVVYKEVLPMIDQELLEIPEDKITDDIKELQVLLKKLSSKNLEEGSMTEVIEARIRKVVEAKESADIEKQLQIYEEWEKTRMSVLQGQLEEQDRRARIENVEEMKKDLEIQERILTFFEREEEIELQIERKLQMEEEKYGPPIEVKEDLEDSYIPPEVQKKVTQ